MLLSEADFFTVKRASTREKHSNVWEQFELQNGL